MATHNTSSAYELHTFEKELKKELTANELKVVKNRKKAPVSVLGPGVVCAFLIIIALITLMVYNHVQLNELTTQINDLSGEMEVLQSENVKLTSSLESTETLTDIREKALKMGMQKRDEFQTERIYLYQQDKIERTEATPTSDSSGAAKLAITSAVGRFKEYISKS